MKLLILFALLFVFNAGATGDPPRKPDGTEYTIEDWISWAIDVEYMVTYGVEFTDVIEFPDLVPPFKCYQTGKFPYLLAARNIFKLAREYPKNGGLRQFFNNLGKDYMKYYRNHVKNIKRGN